LTVVAKMTKKKQKGKKGRRSMGMVICVARRQ